MRKIACIVLLLLSCGNALQAQDSAIRKPKIDTLKYNLPAATIEVSKPHFVQRISPNELGYSTSTNLAQVLAKSGLGFAKSNGVSGISTAGIRGLSAEQTQITWEGLQLNSPTLGLSDLSNIQSGVVSSVTLQPGLAAFSGGSGSVGGNLALHSHIEDGARLNYHFNSLLNHNTGFQVAGKINRLHVDLHLGVVEGQNAFRFRNPALTDDALQNSRHNNFEQGHMVLKLGMLHGKRSVTKLAVWLGSHDRNLPGTLLAERNDSLSNRFYRAIAKHHIYGQKFKHEVSSGVQRERQLFRGDDTFRTTTLSWQNSYSVSYVEAWKHRFKASYQNRFEDGQGNGLLEDAQRWRNALQLAWQSPLQKTMLYSAQLRQAQIDDLWSPLQYSGSIESNFKYFNVALSGGKNFRAPTINEWFWRNGGDPNLSPETSHHGEFSWELKGSLPRQLPADVNRYASDAYRFHPWVLTLRQNVYLTRVQSYIRWLPTSDGGVQVQNEGLVMAAGLETRLTLESRPKRKNTWRFSLRHDYNRIGLSNSEELNIGKQLIHVPLHRAVGEFGFQLKRGWGFNYRYNFFGRRFLNDQHTAWMPYYMLNDLSLERTWKMKKGKITTALSLENMLNKHYQVMPWQPMPGRVLHIQLNYQIR